MGALFSLFKLANAFVLDHNVMSYSHQNYKVNRETMSWIVFTNHTNNSLMLVRHKFPWLHIFFFDNITLQLILI